jgi:competence protein ComGF
MFVVSIFILLFYYIFYFVLKKKKMEYDEITTEDFGIGGEEDNETKGLYQ